uniref:Reverse transcriptase Ty1/copia-type domain-containing protein n=1 Tax=Physcomitrium patens TaxID=3218 RepID=A0A2K1KXH2_PHYPA|nr:hypothetical protein PHYPA_005445 [Physcomitrium patens]
MVVQSSMKAKYIVASTSLKELIWLQILFKEIVHQVILLSTIYCNNQSYIAMTQNPYFYDYIKHINIKCHYIRDKVKKNEVVLEFIPINEMKMNIMTKSL